MQTHQTAHIHLFSHPSLNALPSRMSCIHRIIAPTPRIPYIAPTSRLPYLHKTKQKTPRVIDDQQDNKRTSSKTAHTTPTSRTAAHRLPIWVPCCPSRPRPTRRHTRRRRASGTRRRRRRAGGTRRGRRRAGRLLPGWAHCLGHALALPLQQRTRSGGDHVQSTMPTSCNIGAAERKFRLEHNINLMKILNTWFTYSKFSFSKTCTERYWRN